VIDRPIARVLVVDDNPRNIELVEAQLRRSDFHVTGVTSGPEALEAVRQEPPDVILLDVMMPGMDGHEVCRQLKADPATEHIPIVMLTALQDKADKVRALELGANDFLSKPVERAELLARVRTLVQVKRLHDQVANSEAKYRGLIEQLPVISFITSLDGTARLLYVSPQVELLGFPPSAWMDDPAFWVKRLHPEDRERALAALTHTRATGEPLDCEYRLLDSDGNTLWFRSQGVIVPDPNGGAPTLQGFLNDVTAKHMAAAENRRLAEAVERERQTLTAVMGSMTEGLLVLDVAGRVRYCNAKAGELLDTNPITIAGISFDRLLLGLGDRLASSSVVRKAFQEALVSVHQRPVFDLQLLGASPRDLVTQVFPVTSLEGLDEVGILLHDDTHERDLIRTKDELLSVVSHELRTPLASLVGFAELLLKRDYGEAQRREFLTVMYEEGRRLTALISDFLDLQRMESGRQSVHLQPVHLGSVIRRAVASAGEDVERQIVVDLPAGIPEVDADPDRLQQVFANLLSNARKYSPHGGEIRFTVQVYERAVKVLLRDHGLGLPEEAIPRMFQKFYRVDNSDRRAISGTGLGLAICHQIIAEHGGRIGVESDGLGKGSCFWLTLWLSKPNLQRGDVLIVEDDLGFGRLLEEELNTRGFSSVRAANAQAALAVLEEGRPKAIVLDLLLPGLTGEELLARISQNAGGRPPVIVSTVKELGLNERHMLERLGVIAVVQKGPGVASRVGDAVAQALDATGIGSVAAPA
jgi:PAS domain S-box-containing protein